MRTTGCPSTERQSPRHWSAQMKSTFVFGLRTTRLPPSRRVDKVRQPGPGSIPDRPLDFRHLPRQYVLGAARMIPWTLIESATMPGGGGALRLMRRGGEFSIRAGQFELMNSRVSGSEEALAETGVPQAAGARAAKNPDRRPRHGLHASRRAGGARAWTPASSSPSWYRPWSPGPAARWPGFSGRA